ncbi:uncharacterized protein LY89DRAFT_677879 [Mollisia scopiformis]|uniref:Uncharacterized protein n=1 Tax=Mollisia scopiformis TaxID=149040 RepID=A0A132B5U0_MOLSC|nr:uncharacterized protein LY89DRAFT_677879 [Mollisia scopiformis]KUJ07254.1 hypothetical protein LY89DRAFT_677879 [Mollisia scopiformis]
MDPEINTAPLQFHEEDGYSMNSLMNRLDEFQHAQQWECLERLTLENSWLEQHVTRHREKSARVAFLLREIEGAANEMQRALEACCSEEVAADRAWLAFWHVREKQGAASGNGSWI